MDDTAQGPPEWPEAGVCGRWIGAELRYCRATDGLRYFQPGHRCPIHTPAALKGQPELPPGPGWTTLREVGK